MKTLPDFIKESFKISKNKIYNQVYNYKPESRAELIKLVQQLIFERGTNADLNDIDVSEITDMHNVFEHILIEDIKINMWDVSKVKNMYGMFQGCKKFNGDLSYWDVSNVENMSEMFYLCKKFEGKGLNTWNVKKVKNLVATFMDCESFDQNLGNWDLTYIDDICATFCKCKNFKGKGLEKWNIHKKTIYNRKLKYNKYTFAECVSMKVKPKWYTDLYG